MILNSLVIENIRSYEHEEIEFPRGITLFEGDIGSGKSTVLMAVEFALFGLGSQKAESLLAKKSEDGYVILDFSVDGVKYEVKRALKRKAGMVNQDPKNSWIKTGDQKEPLSPSELKQRILQILKFNEPADPKAESRIFRYAVFTPQEAMKEVLSDSKKRLETIRKAFGIEDYSTAAINARELLAELRVRGAILQEKFSDISNLEETILQSLKTVEMIKSEIAKLEETKVEIERKEKDKNNELKEIQAKNSEKTKLESTKEGVIDKIKRSKKRISDIEDEFSESELELQENNQRLEKLLEIKKPETTKSVLEINLEIKRFQAIKDELIKLESEKSSVSSDLSRLEKTLGEKINADKKIIEESLDGLIHEKESLEKFAKEIKEKLDKVNDQKIQRQTMMNGLEKEIAKFSQLGNACPTCMQEITQDHHHKLVDEKKKEVNALGEELKNITDSFFDSNSKLKEIESKIKSYDSEILEIKKILPGIEEHYSKKTRISEIEAKISELKDNFDEFSGKDPIEYLNSQKDSLVQFENAMEQIKQIISSKQKTEKLILKSKEEAERLESEITSYETELENISKRLESFENLDRMILNLEQELVVIRKEITSISSSMATSVERLKNEETKIAENQTKVIESKKWKAKFAKVIQFRDWLEAFFIPTISQIEKQVLLSIWQNFNETYGRWYSILVEDPTKESRIDENFTPIINQDGFEQEIGFLSGGEKTSIALAYRLTLNSLMRKETESMKSNLLILDEPTDGFSKNQLAKVRELLDELKSEQIILVSHEKELEAYVDSIFRVSKENGLSRILRMNR